MKKMSDLLMLASSIGGLSVSGCISDADAGVSLLSCWKRVAFIDAKCHTSIDHTSTESQMTEWFVRLLDAAGLGEALLLSVGDFDGNDWVVLQRYDELSDIAKLWLASESREIVLCDVGQKRIIGVTEEEYAFEAFSFQLDMGEHGMLI